jgi:hypothetical protein
MKASALSAAIPILGRSAEDRKQMKRADPFGLVLRVGSVQQVDLPEPGQAVKDVAPEPQSGPGSDPFAAGRRHWEGCEVQGDLRLVNEKLVEAHRGSALGFRNLTNYIARSRLETGGFRPQLHPRS